ncbi:hypothetical protein MTO96_006637 [Rhipicephalus appendiculatus]
MPKGRGITPPTMLGKTPVFTESPSCTTEHAESTHSPGPGAVPKPGPSRRLAACMAGARGRAQDVPRRVAAQPQVTASAGIHGSGARALPAAQCPRARVAEHCRHVALGPHISP